MLLFTYCDATIFKAHRMPHLKLEELPKLSDTDYTTNLVKRSYPVRF